MVRLDLLVENAFIEVDNKHLKLPDEWLIQPSLLDNIMQNVGCNKKELIFFYYNKSHAGPQFSFNGIEIYYQTTKSKNEGKKNKVVFLAN